MPSVTIFSIEPLANRRFVISYFAFLYRNVMYNFIAHLLCRALFRLPGVNDVFI
jgi:hypothetical protein